MAYFVVIWYFTASACVLIAKAIAKMEKENSERSIIIIDIHEVSRQVSLSKSCIRDMVKAGIFPRPRKLTPGRVGWIRQEVIDWARSLPVTERG